MLIIQLGWITFYKRHKTNTLKKLISKNYYFADVANSIATVSVSLFALSVNVLVLSIFKKWYYALIIDILFFIFFIFLVIIQLIVIYLKNSDCLCLCLSFICHNLN